MRLLTRINKDYYGGALMMVVGLAAAAAGRQYQIGTLREMGAGFFPAATGMLLAIIGLMIAVTSRPSATPPRNVTSHQNARLPDFRGSFCIIASVVAFVLLGKYGGLLPATFGIVFISALGDRSNSILQAAALALSMCLIALVVFWWALKLQLPLFSWGT
jgi:hypothetical protein